MPQISSNSLKSDLDFLLPPDQLNATEDFLQVLGADVDWTLTESDVIEPVIEEPSTTYLLQTLQHLCVINQARLEKKMDDILSKLDSFAIKQFKRKRTNLNRCHDMNRKAENCNGYICKKRSDRLCFAHYVIVNRRLQESRYLYRAKVRQAGGEKT